MRNLKFMFLLLSANFVLLNHAGAQSDKIKTAPAQAAVKKTTTTDAHAEAIKRPLPPAPKNESAVVPSDQAREVKKDDQRLRSGELHSEPMTSPK